MAGCRVQRPASMVGAAAPHTVAQTAPALPATTPQKCRAYAGQAHAAEGDQEGDEAASRWPSSASADARPPPMAPSSASPAMATTSSAERLSAAP